MVFVQKDLYKINIAEILKNCPKGMELDCTMYEDVYFDYVDELNIIHCYIQRETHKTFITFNQHGTPNSDIKSKCVIFPKGKPTWEGFQKHFKNGDIIFEDRFYSICIFKKEGSIKGTTDYYCGISLGGFYVKDEKNIDEHFGDISDYRFATEEEKQKLFKAIKDNGYKWNEETKTLEKLNELIKPKFKVGDRIKDKYVHKDDCAAEYTIRKVCTKCYKTDCGSIPFENQDNFVLITTKFDITKMKPFDKVLVRERIGGRWHQSFFGYHTEGGHWLGDFVTFDDKQWVQCIPYEGNEHLVNTSNDCSSFYETWE